MTAMTVEPDRLEAIAMWAALVESQRHELAEAAEGWPTSVSQHPWRMH